MSIYHRYAQGKAKTNNAFVLDDTNIDRFQRLCEGMHTDLSWIKSMISLEKRQQRGDYDDALYTQEFVESRLRKLRAKRQLTQHLERYKVLRLEQEEVNERVDVVFPQAMNENSTPEIHQEMESLNDRRIACEDAMVELLKEPYGELFENLPKLFFMILEGVDIETVNMCFTQMKRVLTGAAAPQQAMNTMMNTTIKKYNLPSNIYDHLKKGKGKK